MSAQPAPPPPEPLGHPDPVPVPDTVVPDTVVPGARSLARRVMRPLLRAWLRLDATGTAHVPATGPVIIASTHASHADSIALGSWLPRPVYFLGDLRLTRVPVLGPWLPRLGMVPVRRGEGDTDALDRLTALLGDGQAVVVFPEGSRTRDGAVHRPRSGVSRLAAQLQVPVVPAAVVGTYAVWPTGSRPRLRGGKASLRFAPPLAPPDDTPASRRAFNLTLHETLVALSGAPRADTFSPAHGGDDPEEASRC